MKMPGATSWEPLMNQNVEQWKVHKTAVSSECGVVAAQNWMAAAAGADILARGGNAVDAAVACAFALGAVEPWMCGLGGSGYMVIWKADKKQAFSINFQGILPKAIDAADYPLDPSVPNAIMGFPGVAGNTNVTGYKSITVPGAVAGLSQALKLHGQLGFDTALMPAIQLADRGLPVDWFTTLQIALEASDLGQFPASAGIYLPQNAPAQPEQFLRLGNLANTLKTLAEKGPSDFYKGSIASSISADLEAGGSRITIEDLAAYEPILTPPLAHTHRGVFLLTPDNSSGGPRLGDALNYSLENLDISLPFGGHTYKTYAHALNNAFVNHENHLGRLPNTGCTSHMSAADADGNMVALTYTLLNRFGSKVVLPETGVIMNNAISYFDPRPGYPTSMESRKRINASNMCPTICIRDNKALFAIGASGANHIVPCTMQLAAFMLDYGMSLENAFNTPRIDAGCGDSIRVDPGVGDLAIAELSKEFKVEIAQNLVFPKLYSSPSGVYRNASNGETEGCSDKMSPSSGAVAQGYFEITQPTQDQTLVRA